MQINCVCMLDHGLEITRIEEQNPKQNSIKQRWVLNLFTIHKQHLTIACAYTCVTLGGSECTQYILIKRIGSRGRGRWIWTCYLLLRWCLLVVVLELLLKLLTNLQDKQDHG